MTEPSHQMKAACPRVELFLPGGESGRGIAMAFRHVSAGEFLMGSRGENDDEEPVHRVQVAEPYWMAETPVTQAQFAAWTRSRDYEAWRAERTQKQLHENHFKGRPDHPAESMTWDEASAYCIWLTGALGRQLPDGHVASLPCEAEWEYACRARSRHEYCNGDGEARLRRVGWFGEEWGKGSTHAVGAKVVNDFGLHDMHGNVWEWCEDVWDRRAYCKREDGWVARPWTLEDAGADAASPVRPIRVVRGGAWSNTAGWCRSAYRYRWWPGSRDRDQGFRVCLVHGPASSERQTSGAKAKPDADAGGQGALAGGQAT